MIRLKMTYMKHTVELVLPTDYEHVLVSLWKLGLKRDPGKYTLCDLNAVFIYDTPVEHQMIRLIDSKNTLLYALRSLHEMMAPPAAIADQFRRKIWEGHYNTADEFYLDLEEMVFGRKLCQTYYLFPISGQLLDKAGNAKRVPWDTMMDYEDLIGQALFGLIILRQDDAVAILYITTNSNRMSPELWVQHTLDTGVKTVHVAVQDYALHDGHSFQF